MSSEHNKERIIGSSILLGGGLLLSAVFYRVNYVNQPELAVNQPDQSAEVVQIPPKKDRSTMGELTADYQTEQRILAQKKEERAARVAKQERMVNDYLRVQEEANVKALKKADKEFNATAVLPSLPISEDVNDEALSKIPSSLNAVETSSKPVKKPEPTTSRQDEKATQAKTTADVSEAERLQAAKKEQERRDRVKQEKADKKAQEQAYSTARKQLKDARAKAIMSGEQGDYAVQVAMAGSQELADDLAAKLRKSGYKVMTSKTTRGVRVIVGHERGQEAAAALKNKVNADGRLGIDGAWVMKLKPEHLRAEKAQAKKQAEKKSIKKPITAKSSESSEKPKADEKSTADKSRYGVQVAMAGTKEDADRLIKKLEKNGYKVSTSDTTRGTRIIVGAGLKKAEAQKLQAKVNNDSRVGVSGAWMRRER